jgi:hypothetical protein
VKNLRHVSLTLLLLIGIGGSSSARWAQFFYRVAPPTNFCYSPTLAYHKVNNVAHTCSMATDTWMGMSNSANALQLQGTNRGSGTGSATRQAYVGNQTHDFELNAGLTLLGTSVDQTVVQPNGTSFGPNVIGPVRYAANYVWTQSPGSPSTISVGANVVTIEAVLGISAYSVTKVQHYLWIAAQGTPERVLITATTCTGIRTGTCTVTFTAANSHGMGYTLGTATAGWQEAWVDAWPVSVVTNPIVASKVAGSPNNNGANLVTFNAPLDIDMTRGTQAPLIFDFQGATLQCNVSGGRCIDIGTGTAGTLTLQPYGLTIQNLLIVPIVGMGRTANGTTVAIHDEGQKTRLSNVSFGYINANDFFDDLVVVDADQDFVFEYGTMNSGNGPPLKCDATYCGSGIKGTTLDGAAIGYIHNADLSMQCNGNSVDWQSGNTLAVRDSIVQAFNQFGVRAMGGFDTTPGVNLDNVYEEVGSCTNPLGTGTAGVISNGNATIRGMVGPSGKLPSYTATSVGATQFNYYVVAKSSTLGTGYPLLAGYCLSSGAGTCAVKFNQLGSSGTMTWDIVRTQGAISNSSVYPYTAICTGGSVSTCGSVTTGLTTAACSNNVCSLSDDVTASTSSYTILAAPAFFPGLTLWPGGIVLGTGGDTNNTHLGSGLFATIDKYHPGSTAGGIVTTGGRRNTNAIISLCGSIPNVSGWVSCQVTDSSLGNGAVAQILQLGSAPGSSLKGRTIFESDPFNTSVSTDLITLSDSDPAKTVATPGYRAASDANDVAIGIDQAITANSAFRLGLRAPIGHRRYIGSIFDNSSWVDDLSSTLYSLKVPKKDFAASAPTGGAGFGNFWFDTSDRQYEMKNGSNTALKVGNFKITSTCGNTTTCSGTAVTNPQVVIGRVTLAGGTATVTGLPAFTSTSTFECTANDKTALRPVQVTLASSSSITLTGTGADVVAYSCIGN